MENKIREKPLELMILKFDKNVILHPKEIINTDYLRETVSFNQKNASSLKSGKKMSEELDEVFRKLLKK